MLNVRTLLRAALIPLGAALLMRGVEDLQHTADELQQLVDERRAYLAGDGPLPAVDEQPAPQDFPPPAELENRAAGKSAARAALAGAAGVLAGVLIGRAAARWAHRAELAGVARDVAVVVAKNDELLAEQRRARAVDEQPDVDGHEHTDTCPCPPLLKQPEAADGLADPDDEALDTPADVDEHQDVDEVTAAAAAAGLPAGGDWGPYGCPYCAHVEPPRLSDVPGSRAARIALHRNRHQRGLVGG